MTRSILVGGVGALLLWGGLTTIPGLHTLGGAAPPPPFSPEVGSIPRIFSDEKMRPAAEAVRKTAEACEAGLVRCIQHLVPPQR